MQIFNSLSKYFILSAISCSFLIAWKCTNNNILGYEYAPPIEAETTAAPATSSQKAKSIWVELSSEMQLDHNVQSARVQKEIRRLLADREDLIRILKSAAPYIHYIYSQTKSRGLPAELALIPVIESEFNPNDRSRVGATGLWQLMPKTAQELGVNVKSNYDGRRNVVYSTKAALAYFKDLGNLFKGNWHLAIAAYNCGQFRVMSAMKRADSKSFWNLSVPQETKLYVPRLLAVAAILKNPQQYGVNLPHVNNQPYFTELKVKKTVKLEKVAESAGISLKTLTTLNPDYNHTPIPKKGAYTLLVPANKAYTVKAQLVNTIISENNNIEPSAKSA